jgi:predicted esterase
MGFSQGACLTLEFVARHARRYAAAIAFTGGLIGPPGTTRNYSGDLDGTPVFIGSSDVDAHVPLERVRESTAVLSRMGAQVDERIYPQMGHTINADELEAADVLLARRTK